MTIIFFSFLVHMNWFCLFSSDADNEESKRKERQGPRETKRDRGGQRDGEKQSDYILRCFRKGVRKLPFEVNDRRGTADKQIEFVKKWGLS